MSIDFHKPAFITFTGVDRTELIPGMLELSSRYPIEWGILVDSAQEEHSLFPGYEERKTMLSSALRFSAHVCGQAAQDIARGKEPAVDLKGFSRIQLNHSRDGSSEEVINHAYHYSVRHGLRLALQCQEIFPRDVRADWLYDVSFGTGLKVNEWPPIKYSQPFCGFSGGLSADTITGALESFKTDADYWIDMESGVRTKGFMDLKKCEQVCRLIYD